MSSETIPPLPTVPISPQPDKPLMSVAEYLAMERKSDVRHEYLDGEIRAMSGETPQHNRVAGNVYLKFEIAFGVRPCTSYMEGVRVRVTPTQYRYPDVVALCGEERFDGENPPALVNPSVIVEVLSPSTHKFDREEKFIEYRKIVELTDYLLIEQDQVLVVHYARQGPTQWIINEYMTSSDTVVLRSLEISITLEEIYRKVTFPIT